ncbi:hypothetical protein BN13_1080003 [Nostocoides jenkinsii Ben 74]|uniref:Uncharacterized protein n=1 Tax=Nostocoides jenkinsii Ben 74 TaxID=1193518 RepID=A0A077M6W1_9MICO|nr:hypothetical protein BN13_1080003 [Tetrasphaera jenkinsii Ben 74]
MRAPRGLPRGALRVCAVALRGADDPEDPDRPVYS